MTTHLETSLTEALGLAARQAGLHILSVDAGSGFHGVDPGALNARAHRAADYAFRSAGDSAGRGQPDGAWAASPRGSGRANRPRASAFGRATE